MSEETATALHRRNLTLFASSQEMMRDLRRELWAASDSEVVRYALRYLDQLLSDQAVGRNLFIERSNGERFVVSYLTLQKQVGDDETIEKRNIKLNQAAVDGIEWMKNCVGVSSDSEIVRRAIRYLWLVLSESKNGSEFVLTDGTDETHVRMDVLTASGARNQRPRRNRNSSSQAEAHDRPDVPVSNAVVSL